MYRITKQFAFCASHHLEGLSEGHKCGRDHGHNYVVEVELQSEALNDVGFVQDYGELDGVKELVAYIDHHDLNDRLFQIVVKHDRFGNPYPSRAPAPNPTAENLAKWFYDAEHAATWGRSTDDVLTISPGKILITIAQEDEEAIAERVIQLLQERLRLGERGGML